MAINVDSRRTMESRIHKLQEIIGSDAGGRGMKSLIVPGDLFAAGTIFALLPVQSTVIVLSGFPCCVARKPPTETDGPPGSFAIVRAGLALGYRVVLVTDECNRDVFAAAGRGTEEVELETFPARLSDEDEERFQKLAADCNLLIACERAGPSKDGICYTMRGIDMNAHELIAPLHRLVQECNAPFLAIGDGGNELGMGKVIDAIVANPKISDGAKIGCVIAADHLIAASVSNWGGYALAAAAALARADRDSQMRDAEDYVDRCLPTEQEEIELLDRCVAAGCRDGVSGKMEATVDGMPLETSLQCLRDIRAAALGR
jgi:D-glutamate cyclase